MHLNKEWLFVCVYKEMKNIFVFHLFYINIQLFTLCVCVCY